MGLPLFDFLTFREDIWKEPHWPCLLLFGRIHSQGNLKVGFTTNTHRIFVSLGKRCGKGRLKWPRWVCLHHDRNASPGGILLGFRHVGDQITPPKKSPWTELVVFVEFSRHRNYCKFFYSMPRSQHIRKGISSMGALGDSDIPVHRLYCVFTNIILHLGICQCWK